MILPQLNQTMPIVIVIKSDPKPIIILCKSEFETNSCMITLCDNFLVTSTIKVNWDFFNSKVYVRLYLGLSNKMIIFGALYIVLK